MFINNLGKCVPLSNYREITDKFGVRASTVCEKVNAAGTGENLFRLVPISARAPTKGYVQSGAQHGAPSLNAAYKS